MTRDTGYQVTSAYLWRSQVLFPRGLTEEGELCTLCPGLGAWGGSSHPR